MTRVRARTGSGDYPIEISRGALEQLPVMIRAAGSFDRGFVFYDAGLFALHGESIRSLLRGAGPRFTEMVIPSGERQKSAAVLSSIHDYLLSERVSRSDLILAVGGGVLTDLVGFAAATTLRGIPWGAVPTTVIGQVDAAIGGKTGINHARGKNLIGAFWQPRFVLCDTGTLATLPIRELISGLGEIAKYACLIGDPMARPLTRYLSKGDPYDLPVLTRLAARSARYKARIVEQDEREGGPRMVLNLGHTFGHALEVAAGYRRLRHGEAVLYGLWAALDHSDKYGMGRGLEPLLAMVEALLEEVPRPRLSVEAALEGVKSDKKRRGRDLRLVLLKAPGKPYIEPQADGRRAAATLRRTMKQFGLCR